MKGAKDEDSRKLPHNKIKKIMQANKEIGKIQSSTPLVIGQALELFLQDITRLASNAALANGDSKITPSHVKAGITGLLDGGAENLERFGFLREAVAKIPDLKIEEVPKGGSAKTAGSAHPHALYTGACDALGEPVGQTRRKGKARDKG